MTPDLYRWLLIVLYVLLAWRVSVRIKEGNYPWAAFLFMGSLPLAIGIALRGVG